MLYNLEHIRNREGEEHNIRKFLKAFGQNFEFNCFRLVIILHMRNTVGFGFNNINIRSYSYIVASC